MRIEKELRRRVPRSQCSSRPCGIMGQELSREGLANKGLFSVERLKARYSTGPLVFLLLIGFLWLALPAQAQTLKVGSFTKRTGAAPGSGVEVRE